MITIRNTDGITNRGSLVRMKKLMQRAAAGEKLTIGFLGGSITQGSLASEPELCYAHRVFTWWEKTFPKSEFTYLNAGIGATDSQFGCARAEEDLLDYRPDFVILEFSVNDMATEHYLETYEGLARKLLAAPSEPAVLIVHNVCYDNGSSAQLMHAKIARHYELPAISMQSTIYPELLSGRVENRMITPDDLHPNDEGHRLVASVITNGLETFRRDMDEPEKAPDWMNADGSLLKLPAPITANAYEDSVRYRNDRAAEGKVCCDDFEADKEAQGHITDIFKKGWTASHKGASLEMTVSGSCIGVQYRKTKELPAPVATLVIDGDETHAKLLDANFDETWGDKLVLDTVLEHGAPGPHTVRITLTETHPEDRLPFYLVSVISSGR